MASAYCSKCNVMNVAEGVPPGHTLLCAGGCGTTLALEADAPSQLYPVFTCPKCLTQLALIGNERTTRCGGCGNIIAVPQQLLRSEHGRPTAASGVPVSGKSTPNGGCLGVVVFCALIFAYLWLVIR